MAWFKKNKSRWDKSKYPPNWEDISFNFRASKDFTCEHCGYMQGAIKTSKNGNEYSGMVDAAHRHPRDTANPNPELLCLCKSCHYRHDNTFQETMIEGEHQAELHSISIDAHTCDFCGTVNSGNGDNGYCTFCNHAL